ncbi:MAG: glutamate--tRNA ligase [Hyphomonadaceae bacterium]|nr:glutamate--tRNA ligase [Hyphomonadaceae bacterium]
MTTVTRFAPSPTGFLHIGGARTALFNWLFAKKTGGRYLLRIEDTDRARSTKEAIAAIIDGLSWLGLDADGPPLMQFERAPRHAEAAQAMIAAGKAFRCTCTPDEVEALRAEAHAEGRALRSPWRDGGAPNDGRPFVVRLRAPDDGEIAHDDLVQGRVAVRARDIDDLVLLRADDTPTYMLAVVVDDHDMGVTHVIRGDDHLTNTARQIPIYQALDWPIPRFGHVPMIHGPDGAKLSKRHGALAVQAYRDMGYLPEALCAYLMRLGWSPGHDDVVSKEEAAAGFDLAQIGKSPARLDLQKLDSVNAHFIRRADDARLAALTMAHLAATADAPVTEAAAARVLAGMAALKTRAATIPALAEQARFLILTRPLKLDPTAQKAIESASPGLLARLREAMAALTDWAPEAAQDALKAFAAAEGLKMGQIGPLLRAALTGGAPAPDLGHTLAALGREEALGRLSDFA